MILDCISNDIPPQMNILNMVIPILVYLYACLQLKSFFRLKLECCKLHKAACHPTKCAVIDVKLFPIYCRKFIALSNQNSRYIRKYIRIRISTHEMNISYFTR